jgi:hypothetical protein
MTLSQDRSVLAGVSLGRAYITDIAVAVVEAEKGQQARQGLGRALGRINQRFTHGGSVGGRGGLPESGRLKFLNPAESASPLMQWGGKRSCGQSGGQPVQPVKSVPFKTTRLGRGKWVEHLESQGLKVAHIPGGYGEPVHLRGGGDHGVFIQGI